MENAQKKISQIISIIFHPLLIPTYTLLIVFSSGIYSFIPFHTQRVFYILVALTTFIIPISIMPFLLNLKIVSSFMLQERKERIIPLLITNISYFFTLYLFSRLPFHVPKFIYNYVFASALLISVTLIISIKWKISAHTIGIGGLLGSIIIFSVAYYANLTYLISLIVIISGLIGYARLFLQEHKPFQIYSGFLLGFFGMIIIIYLSYRLKF